MPNRFPRPVRLLHTDQDIDPACMVKLRPPDGPGYGLLLVREGMEARAIVIFDRPSLLVQNDVEMLDERFLAL